MKKSSRSAFIIAAPRSNSGKTVVTLGLIHALVKRDKVVQPFKCGPDYIDTMHHSKIAGTPSYNLDMWMASNDHVKSVYKQQSSEADVSIVEGAMGLFDGAKKDVGSAAAVARMMNLPVVLVVDASSVAYSIAPLLFGFKNFDREVKIAGVIFNKVASESHFQFLKDAAIDADVEVFGYVPRDSRLAIESRHLGLHLPGESEGSEVVEVASELIERYVDIDMLLEQSVCANSTDNPKEEIDISSISDSTDSTIEKERIGKRLTIALASDEAFNFTYRANRNILEQVGEVVEFSPLRDREVPDCDLLWLPGGYPELFSDELANNSSMKLSIQKHIEANRALFAECGGMMYLGESLTTKSGQKFNMAGVFNFETSFEKMKLHLGYRELSLADGVTFRGHEFHYSNLIGDESRRADVTAMSARGKVVDMPVFRYKNCWASYIHIYLGERSQMVKFLKELGL